MNYLSIKKHGNMLKNSSDYFDNFTIFNHFEFSAIIIDQEERIIFTNHHYNKLPDYKKTIVISSINDSQRVNAPLLQDNNTDIIKNISKQLIEYNSWEFILNASNNEKFKLFIVREKKQSFLNSQFFDYQNNIQLFNNLKQGMLIVDNKLNLIWKNISAEKMILDVWGTTGINSEYYCEFLPEEINLEYFKNFYRALAGEKVSFDRNIVGIDGDTHFFEVSLFPYKCGTQNLILLGFNNITVYKSALIKTEKQDKLLYAVNNICTQLLQPQNLSSKINFLLKELRESIDANEIRIYKIDNNVKTVLFSSEENTCNTCRYYGTECTEQINNFETDWYHGGNSRTIITSYHQIENTACLITPILIDKNLWGIISIRGTKGKQHWEEFEQNNIATIAQSLGQAIHRREYERDIISAKNNAVRADNIKADFLAQMSHEIRTPLNSILSFTSLLKAELEEKVGVDEKIIFESIESGGQRLIRTIDLLLRMSELHNKSYRPIIKKVDITSSMLPDLMKTFRVNANKKDVELNYINKTDSPVVIEADENSLLFIFTSLIDNAVKFTEEGHIKVTVYKTLNETKVEIADTGIGISKAYLPKLFEPFTQEESGYTRKYDGNGLGLAIVKQYVELNNISINVKSKKHVGSTFTITIEG